MTMKPLHTYHWHHLHHRHLHMSNWRRVNDDDGDNWDSRCICISIMMYIVVFFYNPWKKPIIVHLITIIDNLIDLSEYPTNKIIWSIKQVGSEAD